MSFLLRLILPLIALTALMQARLPAAPPSQRLMVDLSAAPDAVMLSAFDLCIVEAAAQVDLEAQQALGNKMLARINVFEVAQNSSAAAAARAVSVPLLESAQKGCVRLDATHRHWVPVVVHKIVQAAAKRGFDGFVLTGFETLSHDAERASSLAAIAELDRVYPDKLLMIEGGLDLVSEARRSLDGVILMGGGADPVRRDQRIREVKRHGVQPLVVDFAPAEISQAEIASRTQHFRALGALPFFTTAALDGRHLGPLQEVKRRVLILHSGPVAATFTATILQGSLEWLGYQVEYCDLADVTVETLWTEPLRDVSGVILDATLTALPHHQAGLLALADHVITHHIPFLLSGTPWGNDEDFAAWASRLGLRGSGRSQAVGEGARLRYLESAWLQDPGAIRPRTRGFRDLQGPAGARILSSVQAGRSQSTSIFDQAFLAPWGGVWMDALATQAGPQLRPLVFLENWLGSQPIAPVADVATQNGRLLLIPQVDSQGFTASASVQGLPIAAEVMTERILPRYSLPFTVAVCEGDIRATNPGLDTRDALRYETAARALFALPQVQAASAGHTRPLNWQATPHMEREIAGSMAYIHRHLLPRGKSVELMLWEEDADPTPAAVAFSHQMKVENVQPQSLRSLPGRTPAPPALTRGHGTGFQSLAPGPRRPGPLNATTFIAEAERLSTSRWMQPLHVSFNFHDVLNDSRLWELEGVLDWCAAQPLQAISLADHARLVRDAAQTRFFCQGPGHWIIVNAGHARTFRLPAAAGLPDMERSIGIAGYTHRDADLYVHTLGRRRTELRLTPQGSQGHLRLTASSGQVRYLEAGQQRALLQVADLRPVELTFAGILPGAMCQIYTTAQPQFILADGMGEITVTVPAQTTVRVQVLPSRQSAMR